MKRFQIARKAADTKLAQRTNVVGGCFGLKRTGNTLTKELCYVVYVSRKLPSAELDRADRIPDEVRRHGLDLPTDVVESPGARNEATYGTLLNGEAGTLGSFCHDIQGNIFGLTCAHCVPGIDQDPFTPEMVMLEYPTAANFLNMGLNSAAMYQAGTGMYPNYGDDDFSLISIQNQNIANHARTLAPKAVFTIPNVPMSSGQLMAMLAPVPLTAYGATSLGVRSGRITGVLGSKNGRYFDLQISSDTPGLPVSQPGDSGMVWHDGSGKAYGIHIWGDGIPGQQSSLAFSSLVCRATQGFGVTLVGLG